MSRTHVSDMQLPTRVPKPPIDPHKADATLVELIHALTLTCTPNCGHIHTQWHSAIYTILGDNMKVHPRHLCSKQAVHAQAVLF